MHLQLIRCGGRTAVQRAQQSGLPPRCSKWLVGRQQPVLVAVGCGRTGDSHRRVEIAAQPAQ